MHPGGLSQSGSDASHPQRSGYGHCSHKYDEHEEHGDLGQHGQRPADGENGDRQAAVCDEEHRGERLSASARLCDLGSGGQCALEQRADARASDDPPEEEQWEGWDERSRGDGKQSSSARDGSKRELAFPCLLYTSPSPRDS